MGDFDEKEPRGQRHMTDGTGGRSDQDCGKAASFQSDRDQADKQPEVTHRRASLTNDKIEQLTKPQKQALLLRAVLSDDTTDTELGRMLAALYP
jgi:hypothetical protein